MSKIGMNIKKARLGLKISQEELGRRCKPPMQGSAIRRYENTDAIPKPETLKRIADALDIPLSYLGEDVDKLMVYSTPEDYYAAEEEMNEALRSKMNVKIAYFSNREKELIYRFNKLNETGKDVAIKRIEELTEIKKYTE